MNRDRLVAYFTREKTALVEDLRYQELLTQASLRRRGLAVTGLRLRAVQGKQVFLSGDCVGTRIRPGDHVEVRGGRGRWRGTILDITFDEIAVQCTGRPAVDDHDDLDVVLTQPVLYAPILKSLRELRPGTPGYGYATVLSGERPLTGHGESEEDPGVRKLMDSALTLCPELDQSQRETVERGLQRPAVLGVQGPPGTGKTRVLALLSLVLTSAGHQTVVTAYTHQAVNNCLNEIAGLCRDPDICIVKIGSPHRASDITDAIACIKFNDFERMRSRNRDAKFIVGLTVHSGIVNLTLRRTAFLPNVLLVDEAGQIPYPLGVLLGRFWAGSVLLFGDDAQMPPVFSETLAYDPLSISLFSQLRKVVPDAITMLTTTYRLNAELTEAIGRHYYPDGNGGTQLTAYPPNRENRLDALEAGLPDELGSLLSGHSLRVRLHEYQGQSTYNRSEADEVAAIVGALLQQGSPGVSVAVVSPFRRQCQLIRATLQSLFPSIPRRSIPVVDTVERIQGLSVDVIIVSYGCSDPAHAAATAEFLFSPNRLNVALSRARRKAIVFASRRILDVEPETYEGMLALRSFSELVRRNA